MKQKYKFQVTADTTAQDDFTSTVELTVDDGAVIDVIFDQPEKLNSDDKAFFIWEAIDQLDFPVEIEIKNFIS